MTDIAIAKQKTELAEIKANKTGLLTGDTIDEQYRLAKAFCASKLLPTRFDTPEKVLTAMQLCYELGLKPITGMRQIAVINGTPSMYGDLPLSLVMSSGKCESFDEYVVDKDGKKICEANKNIFSEAMGSVCVVKRQGYDPRTFSFTLEDAKRAGLANGPVWKAYPKTMLKMRARSQALKDVFPDVLNGVAVAEYDFHTNQEAIDSAQIPGVVGDKASELNQILTAQVIDVTPVEKPVVQPEFDPNFDK